MRTCKLHDGADPRCGDCLNVRAQRGEVREQQRVYWYMTFEQWVSPLPRWHRWALRRLMGPWWSWMMALTGDVYASRFAPSGDRDAATKEYVDQQ